MADNFELKIIKKNQTEVELQLLKNSVVLDMLIMPLDFHFETVLVTSIDKILKENRIEKVSLFKVSSVGFEDDSSMASMIVKTVAEALKI